MSKPMIHMLIRVLHLGKDSQDLKGFKTNLESREDKERMIFMMNSIICLEIMAKSSSLLKLKGLILQLA
jgi:hypothetical protein